MLEILSELGDWEEGEEEGTLQKEMAGDGWVGFAYVQSRAPFMRAAITTNIMFDRKSFAKLGLLFAHLHTASMGTFSIGGPKDVLESHMYVYVRAEASDREVGEMLDACCESLREEVTSVLPLMRSAAAGAIVAEDALSLLRVGEHEDVGGCA